MGIAPGADIDVYGIWLRDSSNEEEEPPDNLLFLHEMVEAVLRDSDPHIVNMSFGVSDFFVENFLTDADRPGIMRQWGQSINYMAQRGVSDPTIFVRSAGNDNGAPCDLTDREMENCVMDTRDDFDPNDPDNEYGTNQGMFDATSPSPDAALMVFDEDLQRNMVVVVSIGEDWQISDFSNRCGVAADWCIAAPGVSVTAADSTLDGDTQRVVSSYGGTSFAAPMVSGGLALMRHYFRGNLSNPQLLERLFATAVKSGSYADREIYGQGLMDIRSAMRPEGTPLLPGSALGSSVASANGATRTGAGLASTRIHLGAAFGDGLSRSLRGHEVAAFDALGAPFWYNLSGFINLRERDGDGWRQPWLQTLRRADAPSSLLTLGFTPDSGPGFTANRMAAAVGDWEFAAFTTANPNHRRQWQPQQGAMLTWRPEADAARGYGIRLGLLNEPATLLGSRSSDGFGRLSSRSAVLGLEWRSEWLGWRIKADTEWGFVDGLAHGGLLSDLSGVATSAATLRGSRRLGHRSQFALALSQPPRIESGHLRLHIPVGRTPEGQVLMQRLNASLAPSKRQVDVMAQWQRAGLWGGEFRLGALYTQNPGHLPTPSEAGFLVGWERSF